MSNATGQEPSMEEILASIRKVISEDDEEGTEAEEEIAEAEPKQVFEEDDTLELTEEFEPDLAEEIALVDEVLNDEGLVSAVTTEAGASAFALLAGAYDSTLLLGRADRTLESLVRVVMRPLLSSWLEANLPNVVERLVQAEIQKMSDKIER